MIYKLVPSKKKHTDYDNTCEDVLCMLINGHNIYKPKDNVDEHKNFHFHNYPPQLIHSKL